MNNFKNRVDQLTVALAIPKGPVELTSVLEGVGAYSSKSVNLPKMLFSSM